MEGALLNWGRGVTIWRGHGSTGVEELRYGGGMAQLG